MSNGNGSNFYADVRMKIMNLRIKQNNELDDLSKWVDESEQQMLAKNKGIQTSQVVNHSAAPTSQVANDSVIEAEKIIPGLSGKPDRE